jgi:hypothetical protein
LRGRDRKDHGSKPAQAKRQQDPISTNKVGIAVCACHQKYLGSISRRTAGQEAWGITPDLIQKITKAKRAGDLAQALEHLPSKCQTLSSNPSTANTIPRN